MGNKPIIVSDDNELKDWRMFPSVEAFKNEPGHFTSYLGLLATSKVWVATRTFTTRCDPPIEIKKGTILEVMALTKCGHARVNNPDFRFEQYLSGHELTEVHAQGQDPLDIVSILAPRYCKSPRPEDVEPRNEVEKAPRKFSFPSDSGEESTDDSDTLSSRHSEMFGNRLDAPLEKPQTYSMDSHKYVLSPRSYERGRAVSIQRNTSYQVLPHQKTIKRRPKSARPNRIRHKSAYSARYRS